MNICCVTNYLKLIRSIGNIIFSNYLKIRYFILILYSKCVCEFTVYVSSFKLSIYATLSKNVSKQINYKKKNSTSTVKH